MSSNVPPGGQTDPPRPSWAPGPQGQGPHGQGPQQPPWGGEQPTRGPGQSPQNPAGPPQGPGQPPWGAGPGQPPRPGYGPLPPTSGPTPGPSSGSGKRLGLIIGGIALALVLIVSVTIAVLVNRGDDTAAPAPEGQGGGGDAPVAATPEQVVEGYLQALAENRAEDALGALADPPADTSVLTDEVLTAGNEQAQIGGISVTPTEADDYSATVTADYTIGDTAASFAYDLYTDRDDAWKISTGTIRLYTDRLDGLEITVNGQVPDTVTEIEVFPGAYEIGTEMENFAVEGGESLVVYDPFDSASTSDLQPVLSEAGTESFRSLVNAAAEECVASTDLEAGCGLTLPAEFEDGTPITDGTIERTLPADTRANLDSLEADLSYDNPTLASAASSLGSVSFAAECEQDGETFECEALFGAPGFSTPSVDMAAADPVVEWD